MTQEAREIWHRYGWMNWIRGKGVSVKGKQVTGQLGWYGLLSKPFAGIYCQVPTTVLVPVRWEAGSFQTEC